MSLSVDDLNKYKSALIDLRAENKISEKGLADLNVLEKG
jgi:hypothetical protein